MGLTVAQPNHGFTVQEYVCRGTTTAWAAFDPDAQPSPIRAGLVINVQNPNTFTVAEQGLSIVLPAPHGLDRDIGYYAEANGVLTKDQPISGYDLPVLVPRTVTDVEVIPYQLGYKRSFSKVTSVTGRTFDATPVLLMSVDVPINRAVEIEVSVLARRITGTQGVYNEAAFIQFFGLYRWDSTTLRGVGPLEKAWRKTSGDYDASLAPDTTRKQVDLTVTGKVGHDMVWDAEVAVRRSSG